MTPLFENGSDPSGGAGEGGGGGGRGEGFGTLDFK